MSAIPTRLRPLILGVVAIGALVLSSALLLVHFWEAQRLVPEKAAADPLGTGQVPIKLYCHIAVMPTLGDETEHYYNAPWYAECLGVRPMILVPTGGSK